MGIGGVNKDRNRKTLSVTCHGPVEVDNGKDSKHHTSYTCTERKGTPQWVPISPLICNIYMRRFTQDGRCWAILNTSVWIL